MRRNAKERAVLKKLERLAGKIIKIVRPGEKNRRAEIFLLGDKEMRHIKKRFLPREKGPANVLAFGEPAYWPHPESHPAAGEIYLNLELTEGRMSGLVPLLLHGVLHILGYDHKKKNDRIKMEKLEKKILKTLDIRN